MSLPAEVNQQLRTACRNCLSHQISLTDSASEGVEVAKVETGLLFVFLHLAENRSPSATLNDAQKTNITDLVTRSEGIATMTDLDAIRQQLCKLLRDLAGMAPDAEITPLTTNQLNKRMINLLFEMQPTIRATRRRLNAAGGGYDRVAYAAARRKAVLAQHVYIDQLNSDFVFATIEEAATLEKIHYRDISQATAATFVQSIEELVTFLEARVLA